MKLPEMKALSAGILAASVSTGALAGTVTTDGPDMVIKTDSGFSAQTVDGAYSFDIGGRIMLDYDYADGIYDQNGAGAVPDNDGAHGFEVRRARIELKGTSDSVWHYSLGINMSDGSDAENGGANTIDTASITYTGFDAAWVRVGRDKIPFNLEEMTSSKYISTIERGFYQDYLGSSFGKAQHIAMGGTMAGQFTWAFAPVIDKELQSTDAAKQLGYGGRVTWSPVHDTGNVIHVGLGYQDNGAEQTGAGTEDQIFRTRFGVHNVDDFDDGNAACGAASCDFRPRLQADLDDDTVWNLEGAWVAGPFSVQGEYFQRDLSVAATSLSPEVTAWYLQTTWTLTGESRSYKWKDGKFDKIKPKGKNGAIELVAKYEDVSVDLDQSNGMSDLDADLITLGVNWYATQHVAVKLNYLILDTDGYDAGNLGLLNGAYTATSFPRAGSEEDGDAITARIQYIF